jgi:hypothetical protein
MKDGIEYIEFQVKVWTGRLCEAATGKEISIRAKCTNRFAGNRVAEDWELPDLFGMMQQLGAIGSQVPA